MKTIFCLLAFFSFMQAEPLQADEAPAPKKTFSGKIIKQKPPEDEGIDSDSSEALREGQKFSVVVQPFGAIGGFYSYGLTLGYYLRPDSIFEIDRAWGRREMLYRDAKLDLYSFRVKKFWGNSFYTNLGAAYRDVRQDGEYGFLGNYVNGSYRAQSIDIEFSIGNRWQWDNFSIGCDWAGFLAPVVHISEKDTYPATSNSRTDDEDRRNFRREAKAGMGQGLRFYLGVSFN